MGNVLNINPDDKKGITIMNNVSSITDMQLNTFSYMKTDLLYVNRIVDPEGTISNQEDNAYTAKIAIAPLKVNSPSYVNPMYNDCGAVGLINNSQGVSLDFTTVESPLNGSTAYDNFPYNYVGTNLNYDLNKDVYDKVKQDQILLGSRGINFHFIKYIPVVTVTDIDFDGGNNINLDTNLYDTIQTHVKKMFWWDYIKFLDGTYDTVDNNNKATVKIDGENFDVNKWKYIISLELFPAYGLSETDNYRIPEHIRTPNSYIAFTNLSYKNLDKYLVFGNEISGLGTTQKGDSLKGYTYPKTELISDGTIELTSMMYVPAITDRVSEFSISEMFDDKGRVKAQIVEGKYQSNTGERTLINAKLGINSNGVLVFGTPDSYQPLPLYERYNAPYSVDTTQNLVPKPTVMAMPFVPAYNLKEMAENYNKKTSNKNILFTNENWKKFYCNGTTLVNVTKRPGSAIPDYNYFTVPFLDYNSDGTTTNVERIDMLCYAIRMIDKKNVGITSAILP